MSVYKKHFSMALNIIKLSSKELNKRFRTHLMVMQKPGFEPQQIISEADLVSENIIISELEKYFPEHGILSEEMKPRNIHADHTWIIDPLCGSLFFSRGLTQWSISLAFLQGNEVIFCVISNPYYEEIFWAEKNQGAFLNGAKIMVSKVDAIEDSIVSIGHRDLRLVKYESMANKIVKKAKRIITMDNHWVLTQLAAGRIDAVIRVEQPSYEMAAGSLLISEAGGKITDVYGEKISISRDKKRSINYLASNSIIHSSLLEIINKKPF